MAVLYSLSVPSMVVVVVVLLDEKNANNMNRARHVTVLVLSQRVYCAALVRL
jgi:hypothetical protein